MVIEIGVNWPTCDGFSIFVTIISKVFVEVIVIDSTYIKLFEAVITVQFVDRLDWHVIVGVFVMVK